MAATSSPRGTPSYSPGVRGIVEKKPLPTTDTLMPRRNDKTSNQISQPRAPQSSIHEVVEAKTDGTKETISEGPPDDHQRARLVLGSDIKSTALEARIGEPAQLKTVPDEKSGKARSKTSKKNSKTKQKLTHGKTKQQLQDSASDVRERQQPIADNNVQHTVSKHQPDLNTCATNLKSSASSYVDATDPSEKASKTNNSNLQSASIRQKKQRSKVEKAGYPGQASGEITGRGSKLSPHSLNSHPQSSLTNLNYSGSTINKTSSKPTTPKALLRYLTNPKQDTLLQEALSASMPSHSRGELNLCTDFVETTLILFCIGAVHPQQGHTTIRSRKLVDAKKFETEPLPRELRGFQPRGFSQTSEAASSVVTEQHPKTFTGPQEILSRESAVQPHVIGEPATIIDDSRASCTIENSGSIKSTPMIPLATNARKANQAPMTHSTSVAKALTNERSNVSHTKY